MNGRLIFWMAKNNQNTTKCNQRLSYGFLWILAWKCCRILDSSLLLVREDREYYPPGQNSLLQIRLVRINKKGLHRNAAPFKIQYPMKNRL
jgi:hypothetical protein